ncbi:hypothetical protein ACIBTV_27160 [Micromonospora sp. NPDC049366]|uniref:hypothetical protein n=1 Tax=Micromonospora sp. NPDC049366 TaxID=3364271 RepID=UPI0037B60821
MTLDGPQHAAPQRKVETKVTAAATGAGAGVALAELLCWILDYYLITPKIVGDLPAQVSVAVPLAVAAGLAWIAGYKAKHTHRPDLHEEVQ